MLRIAFLRRHKYLLLLSAVIVAMLLVVPLRAQAASSASPKSQTIMNTVTTTPGGPQSLLLTIPGFGTLYVMQGDINGNSCSPSAITTQFTASAAVVYLDTRDQYATYERYNPGEIRWVNGDFVLTTGTGTSTQIASVRVLQKGDPTWSIDCKSVAVAELGP